MAEKVVIQLEADTTQVVKGIDKVDESLQDVSKSTDGLTNSLDKMTGGAISGFKGVTKSVGTAIKGFKSLKIAIAATGIGLLVVAIGALATSFKASEEGQNRFTRIMTQIGVVVGNVTDIIANLGEGVFAAGKALMKLAKGDLKGASAAWGELKTNVSEVTEGIKNFGEETKKEIKIAGELADARAKADKAERKLIVDRAEADRKRAELLEQAIDKEQFSTEQRIGFLEEAGRIEEQITNQEIAAAKLRLEAKQQENSLSKSTKEDLLEEAELKAQVIQLETAKLAKQKEVTSQTIALKAEQAAAEKAIQDEADAAEKEAADKKAKEDAERLKEKQKLEKEAADKKAAQDKEEADRVAAFEQFKKQSVEQGIAGVTALVGQNSKFAKAVAVANAIRDTYAGANKALAQGGIFGFIGAAGIVAAGLANVKTITSTKEPQAPRGISTGGAGASVSAPPQPPAFNIVGASGTNQLAETIAGQNERPVKAFVTSQDVTTAQSLERNIVEGASI